MYTNHTHTFVCTSDTHIWMCESIRMRQLFSWDTHEWVMAHISMSHGTHINESWHTYQWVMAHMSTSIRMHESMRRHMSYSHVWQDTHRRRRESARAPPTPSRPSPPSPHPRAWPPLPPRLPIIHSHERHDSFLCVPWFIHVCAMTHSQTGHEPLLCVP